MCEFILKAYPENIKEIFGMLKQEIRSYYLSRLVTYAEIIEENFGILLGISSDI